MPRNYIRKSLRATCYTPEDLEIAIQRVENKELTMYAASKLYNIPVATLHIRLLKKTGIKNKLTLCTDTDSSTSEIEFKAVDTDSEYENMEDYIEQCLKMQEDEENIEQVAKLPFGGDIKFYEESSQQLKTEDSLVVQFSTKKSVKYFIGRILSIDDKIPIVKFVRKVKQSKSEIRLAILL